MMNMNYFKSVIALLLIRVAKKAFDLSHRIMGKPFVKSKMYPIVSPLDHRNVFGYVTILTENATNYTLHHIHNNPLCPIVVVRDGERETIGYHYSNY